jgi:hypothetical protein
VTSACTIIIFSSFSSSSFFFFFFFFKNKTLSKFPPRSTSLYAI